MLFQDCKQQVGSGRLRRRDSVTAPFDRLLALAAHLVEDVARLLDRTLLFLHLGRLRTGNLGMRPCAAHDELETLSGAHLGHESLDHFDVAP